LSKKKALFAPELRQALERDIAASAKVKDEIVGLDFDPFLDSQDPDSPYRVAGVKQGKGRTLVTVKSPGRSGVTLVAVVKRHGESWQFVDFIYGGEGSLTTILKTLARQRHGG